MKNNVSAEPNIDLIKDNKGDSEQFSSLKNLLNKNLDEMEGISEGGISSGIKVLFHDFDVMTQGLTRGDLIIFAGRPMMGKTSISIQITKNIAQVHNLPVCFFSFDMSKKEITQRLMALEVGIDINRIKSAKLQQDEWPTIGEATFSLGNLPIFVDDNKKLTVEDIKEKSKKILTASDNKNLGLIVIDSFEMMMDPTRENYEQN